MMRSMWKSLTLLAALHVVACGGDSKSSNEDGEDTGGMGQGGSSGTAGSAGTLSGATGSGGTGGTTSVGGAAGTSVGGTAGSAGTATNCNDVQPSTEPVSYEIDAGAPPSPRGGLLTPGLYHLESVTIYGASDTSCTSTLQELALRYSVLVVPESAGTGTLELVLAVQGGEVDATLVYTLDGLNLSTGIVCGTGSGESTPYTAGTNQLLLFEPATETCGPRVDVLRLE